MFYALVLCLQEPIEITGSGYYIKYLSDHVLLIGNNNFFISKEISTFKVFFNWACTYSHTLK